MRAQIQIPSVNAIQQGLMQMVLDAHDKAARTNPSSSTLACQNAGMSTGSAALGIASAMMTLGSLHAPIEAARVIYETATQKSIIESVMQGNIIPGFGNSFFKVGIDPAWEQVSKYIELNLSDMHGRIYDLTQWMHRSGKILYPNAALFSAAAASECGVKRGAEVAIFAIARIPAWAEMAIA